MSEYVLVLDAGSGAGRAVLIPLAGGEPLGAYQEWSYTFAQPDHPEMVEFDPAAFWRILCQVAGAVIRRHGVRPEQVLAVTSTSQREGLVLLDGAGRELYAGPNIDRRRPKDGSWLTPDLAERLYRRTGHWPVPMFAPFRLLWLREQRPEVLAAARHLLMINDWILFKLSGEQAVEVSNGSETGLQNLAARDWAWDLIADLGLPDCIFPPTVEAGTTVGTLRPAVAAELGLRPGIPVVAGGADTQCGVLAAGAMDAGQTALVAGTWNPLQMVVDRPLLDPQYRTWTGSHVVPGRWVLDSSASIGGLAYRWLRDTFYPGARGYDQLNAEAAAAPAGCNGLLAFLGAGVMNSRVWDPGRVGGFVGPNPVVAGSLYGRGHYARAAVEAMAYAVRANCEQLTAITGHAIRELRACGGGTCNPLFMPILAGVLGVPVRVPKVREGSSLGAAIAAATGIGYYPDLATAVAAMVEWDQTFTAGDDLHELYERHYRRWRTAYERLAAMVREE